MNSTFEKLHMDHKKQGSILLYITILFVFYLKQYKYEHFFCAQDGQIEIGKKNHYLLHFCLGNKRMRDVLQTIIQHFSNYLVEFASSG